MSETVRLCGVLSAIESLSGVGELDVLSSFELRSVFEEFAALEFVDEFVFVPKLQLHPKADSINTAATSGIVKDLILTLLKVLRLAEMITVFDAASKWYTSRFP